MLNPDETIILVAQHGDDRILVGLHPEPGNYEVTLPPGIQLEDGTRWALECPVCHHDLAIEADSSLCALIVHAGGSRGRVLFSSIAGHQATFVVSEESEKEPESHGRDADRYWQSVVQMKYLL
jgi:hypothetical protein